MTISLGVVMDPIQGINTKKDSTFAMLLEAQARGWRIIYMLASDLYLAGDRSFASGRPLRVEDNPDDWYRLGEASDLPLDELDVILMRKDPPFDIDYIYTTYLLERAELRGSLVINRPAALRDCNEKLYTAWFPQCIPPTLVSCSKGRILEFLDQQKDIILKPLDGMGGSSIFRTRQGDPNTQVIIETLTHNGRRLAMVQRFIPEITQGDKRILMVNGEPVPYALARIPREGETRGNLAAGGTGVGIPLGEQDLWIARQVGPELVRRGILFAGLDVIGDYLTEVNVTSPTCIRELDAQFDLNISAELMDCIEEQLAR